MSKVNWPDALKRTARTAMQAFLALVPTPTIVAWLAGTEDVDKTLLYSALGTVAVTAATFLWNTVIDPSPIPSLAPDDNLPH